MIEHKDQMNERRHLVADTHDTHDVIISTEHEIGPGFDTGSGKSYVDMTPGSDDSTRITTNVVIRWR